MKWEELVDKLSKDEIGRELIVRFGKQVWQQLEEAIARHPHLHELNNFEVAYINTLWARILLEAKEQNAIQDISYTVLEQSTGIARRVISSWFTGEKEPMLSRSLRLHEASRSRHEKRLPPEAHQHRIDPSSIYHTFKPLYNHPTRQTPEHLANAIAQLYHTIHNPAPVIFAELKPYHNPGPRWLYTIAKAIHNHLPEIQRHLNEKLCLDRNLTIRITINNSTLYIWRHNTDPDYWLNLYDQELIYLNTIEEKHQLITLAQRHLNRSPHKLTAQLTHHPSKTTPAQHRLTDFEHARPYLLGESLHFLLDATNQTLTDIQHKIARIGRAPQGPQHGGILNPRFPEGESLNQFRARAFAIIASDSHTHPHTHQLVYTEKDPDRREYVKTLFQSALGDVYITDVQLPGLTNRLAMPAVVGRLLEKWGIPVGDKHLHPEFRLPETIRHGSHKAKRAYLEEVIPEDGSFSTSRKYGWFKIGRAVILDAGPKTVQYQFTPKITPEHKEFIRHQGRETTVTFGYTDQQWKRITLPVGTLTQLEHRQGDPHTQRLAQQLREIIEENSCQLLDDETALAQSLGINVLNRASVITLWESGRLSVTWTATTKDDKAAIRWAILAPPASGRKRKAAKRWLATRKDEAQRIHQQLYNQGLIAKDGI